MFDYSVVIRCKNEDQWLPDCLRSLQSQTIPPSQIILVDNSSTDNSVKIAKNYDCQVVSYPQNLQFNYSKALNIGICRARFPKVLLLSAHCILHTHECIQRFAEAFSLYSPAGVFGRQLPTQRSSAADTRDLLTVFGREAIVYRKYPFFHNAFSMISKSAWRHVPFDESINGIEDRVWSQKMCDNRQTIVYVPSACVYHEHGLNQTLNEKRAARVCKALYELHKDDVFSYPPDFVP